MPASTRVHISAGTSHNKGTYGMMREHKGQKNPFSLDISLRRHHAQQESLATSLVNVCAASFSPSTVVR